MQNNIHFELNRVKAVAFDLREQLDQTNKNIHQLLAQLAETVGLEKNDRGEFAVDALMKRVKALTEVEKAHKRDSSESADGNEASDA